MQLWSLIIFCVILCNNVLWMCCLLRSTPVIVGQKVVQRYFRGVHYVETDLHIGSSKIADNIVSLCRKYSKAFACNICKSFVVYYQYIVTVFLIKCVHICMHICTYIYRCCAARWKRGRVTRRSVSQCHYQPRRSGQNGATYPPVMY